MSGQRLGRLSLRLDAIYCAVLGAVVAVFAPLLAEPLGLPFALIAAAGVTVIAWAVAVEWMRARLPLRRALRAVMCANIVATAAVAVFSVTAAAFIMVLALVSVAIDVALFAGSQAWALTRLPRHAT